MPNHSTCVVAVSNVSSFRIGVKSSTIKDLNQLVHRLVVKMNGFVRFKCHQRGLDGLMAWWATAMVLFHYIELQNCNMMRTMRRYVRLHLCTSTALHVNNFDRICFFGVLKSISFRIAIEKRNDFVWENSSIMFLDQCKINISSRAKTWRNEFAFQRNDRMQHRFATGTQLTSNDNDASKPEHEHTQDSNKIRPMTISRLKRTNYVFSKLEMRKCRNTKAPFDDV